MTRVIIFANGSLPDLEPARRLIRPGDVLLAADGGTRHALALGLMPSIVIGDLDSLSETDRQRLENAGTRLLQRPRDKNATDLELALYYALEQGYTQVVILAALGGRLDQTLANLALLTDPRLSALDMRLDDGVEEAWFTRREAQVRGARGDLLSLIPWGGAVAGVRTQGLRWPLDGETLYPYKTRGISNEMLGKAARLEIESGLMLIVHRRQSSI
jgi:thiamine pyrophosphokinase